MKKKIKVDSNNSESDFFLLKKLSHKSKTDLTSAEYQRLTFFRDNSLEFSELVPEFCKLNYPLDLLDPDQIRSNISDEIIPLVSSIDRQQVIDSTNTSLLESADDQIHGRICLAEYQTAGRGRHGRSWVAPFASGLCFSIGWQFFKKIDQLQLISLLPAVALIRILKSLNLKNVGVKWPNDILCDGDKLAGILIEMPKNISDPNRHTVVIGLGINVYNRAQLIEQPWTSLDQKLDLIPSRSKLAGLLITEIFGLLKKVEEEGFENIRNEWRTYDLLINKPVAVLVGDEKQNGISRGINDDGSIIVEINGELKSFMSGEISLRAV